MLHKTSVIATYTLYALDSILRTVTSLPPPKSIFGRGRAAFTFTAGFGATGAGSGAATAGAAGSGAASVGAGDATTGAGGSLAASCSAVRKISFASTAFLLI